MISNTAWLFLKIDVESLIAFAGVRVIDDILSVIMPSSGTF